LHLQPYLFFVFADYPGEGMPVEILTPGYRKGFEKRAKRKVIDDFHNSHWFGETIK
jgi:hypothetical protein